MCPVDLMLAFFFSLEGRIKAMMEKAFWDMLRDDLESGDPTYEQALGLLAEIKEVLSLIAIKLQC